MTLAEMPQADRVPGYVDGSEDGEGTFPVTARKRLGHYHEQQTDLANRAAAHAAGVKRASQIHYAEALGNYEDREDVETLASTRSRAFPASFDEAEYMRELPNRSGGNGIAPDPDNEIVTDFFAGTNGSSV